MPVVVVYSIIIIHIKVTLFYITYKLNVHAQVILCASVNKKCYFSTIVINIAEGYLYSVVIWCHKESY